MQRIEVFKLNGILGPSGTQAIGPLEIQKPINDFLHEYPSLNVLDIQVCSDAAAVFNPHDGSAMGSLFEFFVILRYEADDTLAEQLRKRDFGK